MNPNQLSHTVSSELLGQLLHGLSNHNRVRTATFSESKNEYMDFNLSDLDIMEDDDMKLPPRIPRLRHEHRIFDLMHNLGDPGHIRQRRNQTFDLKDFTYILQRSTIQYIIDHPKQGEWLKTITPNQYHLGKNDRLLITFKGQEYMATPLSLSFVFQPSELWLQQSTYKRIKAEKKFVKKNTNSLWFLLWEQPYIFWDVFASLSYRELKHTQKLYDWWAIMSEFALNAHYGAIGKFTQMFTHSPMVDKHNNMSVFESWARLMEARKKLGLSRFIIPRVTLNDCKTLFPYYKQYQRKHLPWETLPWRHLFLKVSIRRESPYKDWFSMKDKIDHIHHICFHAYHAPQHYPVPFISTSLFSCSHHFSQLGLFENLDTLNKKQIFYSIFFPGLKGLVSYQDISVLLDANLNIPYTYWIKAYISTESSKRFLTEHPKEANAFLSFWKSRGIQDNRLLSILRWTNCIDSQTGYFMLDKLCRLAVEQGQNLTSILEINDRVIVSPDTEGCRYNPKRLTLLKSDKVSPLMKRVLWQNTHYMYDSIGHITCKNNAVPVLNGNKMMFDKIIVTNLSQPVSLENHALTIYYNRKIRMVDFSNLIQIEFMETNIRPPQHRLQNQVTILFHNEVGIGEGVRQEVFQCIWDDAIKDGMFMWADQDETCLIPGPGEFGEEKLYNMARLTALCVHQGLFIPYRFHEDFWETLCEGIINEDRLQDMEDHFVSRWMDCQKMYADFSTKELAEALDLDEKEASLDKDTIIRCMSLPSIKTIKTFVRGWKNSLPGTFITMFKGEWNDMFCEKLWYGGETRKEFENYFTCQKEEYKSIVDHVFKLSVEEQKQFFFFVTGKKRPPQIQRKEQIISIQAHNRLQVRSATCSSQLFIPPLTPIDAEAIVAATTGDYKDGFSVQ